MQLCVVPIPPRELREFASFNVLSGESRDAIGMVKSFNNISLKANFNIKRNIDNI